MDVTSQGTVILPKYDPNVPGITSQGTVILPRPSSRAFEIASHGHDRLPKQGEYSDPKKRIRIDDYGFLEDELYPEEILGRSGGKSGGRSGGRSTGRKLKADNFEDLIEKEGGGKRDDVLEAVSNGKDIIFNSTICALIRKGKIIFKRSIAKGKYGSTILSEVTGLKKNEEYVVKTPHTKKIPRCIIGEKEYTRIDGSGKTIFPKGSYSCDGEISEFIISLFVGDLARKKQSVNFLDTYYFANCGDKEGFHQFMFMAKADTTLRKEIAFLSIEEINSLYVQLLHALAIIQDKYMIVHGDLHLENILLKMDRAVCRSYKFGSETVYSPPCKFIAFPADWGMAVKYGGVHVGNSDILKGFFGDSTPNFFSASYDIVFMTKSFLVTLNKTGMKSAFIRKISDWIFFKANQVIDPEEVYYFKKEGNTYRPKPSSLEKYFNHVSPLNILNNADLMGEYMKKPPRDCAFGGEF